MQRVPGMINPEKNVPQDIGIWNQTKIKGKERVLKRKATRIYRGTPIRLSADFSTEILQTEGSGTIYLSKKRKKTKQIKTVNK